MNQRGVPNHNSEIELNSSSIDGKLPSLEVNQENVTKVKDWLLTEGSDIKPRQNEAKTLFLYATVDTENANINSISRNSISNTVDSSYNEFLIEVDYNANSVHITALTSTLTPAPVDSELQKRELSECFSEVLLPEQIEQNTNSTLKDAFFGGVSYIQKKFRSADQIEQDSYNDKVQDVAERLKSKFRFNNSTGQYTLYNDWKTIREALEQFPKYGEVNKVEVQTIYNRIEFECAVGSDRTGHVRAMMQLEERSPELATAGGLYAPSLKFAKTYSGFQKEFYGGQLMESMKPFVLNEFVGIFKELTHKRKNYLMTDTDFEDAETRIKQAVSILKLNNIKENDPLANSLYKLKKQILAFRKLDQ